MLYVCTKKKTPVDIKAEMQSGRLHSDLQHFEVQSHIKNPIRSEGDAE